MNLLTEIYQFLFISSIIFIIYVLGDLIIKTYGRFKLHAETKFVLTQFEKFTLWIAIAIFFTYLL
jgi:hypothetical protein